MRLHVCGQVVTDSVGAHPVGAHVVQVAEALRRFGHERGVEAERGTEPVVVLLHGVGGDPERLRQIRALQEVPRDDVVRRVHHLERRTHRVGDAPDMRPEIAQLVRLKRDQILTHDNLLLDATQLTPEMTLEARPVRRRRGGTIRPSPGPSR
ncbi:MAG: hypothetical protein DLM58_09305 [Pseudonocardiales bacterium]|nr:MAG: hypothetical protein DLM58_09305 [Pseudonocardiales bacterium]